MIQPSPRAWCRADRCAAPVEPGALLCGRHAAMLPAALRQDLARIDCRGLLTRRPVNEDLTWCLEVAARSLEAVARLEGTSGWNQYRLRLDSIEQRRRAREVARAEDR